MNFYYYDDSDYDNDGDDDDDNESGTYWAEWLWAQATETYFLENFYWGAISVYAPRTFFLVPYFHFEM
jgi:hypothetical protein